MSKYKEVEFEAREKDKHEIHCHDKKKQKSQVYEDGFLETRGGGEWQLSVKAIYTCAPFPFIDVKLIISGPVYGLIFQCYESNVVAKYGNKNMGMRPFERSLPHL